MTDSALDSVPRDDAATLFAERAMREAIEAGLTPVELRALLRDVSVTEVIPPGVNESLAAYADRATSELLTRYLIQGVGDTPPAV